MSDKPMITLPSDVYDRLRDALQRYVDGDDCEYGHGPPCPGDPPGVDECVHCEASRVLAALDALLYPPEGARP